MDSLNQQNPGLLLQGEWQPLPGFAEKRTNCYIRDTERCARSQNRTNRYIRDTAELRERGAAAAVRGEESLPMMQYAKFGSARTFQP